MSDPSDDRDDRRRGNDERDGPDRRSGRSDDEDLDERIADLEAQLRELRTEMTRPPEGPLGLPRPPTPREVLSFAGEYAIPTAIAVLEANIRALRALQRVVRVLDPEYSHVEEGRDRLQSRAADASRATLDRLDDALGEVETAIREGDLPREPEARDLLEDARRINRDIRERIEQSRQRADEERERARRTDADDRDRDRSRDDRRSDRDRGTTIELSDPDDASDEDEEEDRPEVDVDAELRSIKDEIERRETADVEPSDDSSSDDGDSKPSNGDSETDDGDSKTSDGDSRGNGDDSETGRTEEDDEDAGDANDANDE